jgi:hypothetical protein
MTISPPIGVTVIVAIALAAAPWIAPPPREVPHVSVMLPTATYNKLALWGKAHAHIDGRPQSVTQIVTKFAIGLETDDQVSADQSGIRER